MTGEDRLDVKIAGSTSLSWVRSIHVLRGEGKESPDLPRAKPSGKIWPIFFVFAVKPWQDCRSKSYDSDIRGWS